MPNVESITVAPQPLQCSCAASRTGTYCPASCDILQAAYDEAFILLLWVDRLGSV